MKLIHKATGKEVQVGDLVISATGEEARIIGWRTPLGPASSGRIGVSRIIQGWNSHGWFFPTVFGCEFINRHDRADQDSHVMLSLNPATVLDLEAEYNKAVDAGLAEFQFQGNALLVDYAKYLIEYAKQRLGMV